jgi:hypothetical protein
MVHPPLRIFIFAATRYCKSSSVRRAFAHIEVNREEFKKAMKRNPAVTTPILASTSLCSAAGCRGFWILDNPGCIVDNFQMAAHGAEDRWSRDILVTGALFNSIGAKILLRNSAISGYHDFRVSYADGSGQNCLEGRNLCAARAARFNTEINHGLWPLCPRALGTCLVTAGSPRLIFLRFPAFRLWNPAY